jgi:DNA-binding ferritin-like protein
MSGEIVNLMLTLRNQVKIYHWETMQYARHKATDDLVDKLDDAIDKFVEVYIGKYGRPKLTPRTGTIRLRNFDDAQATTLLTEAISWMTNRLPALLSKNDTDLLNIRDEILADLNQTRYLFTFS